MLRVDPASIEARGLIGKVNPSVQHTLQLETSISSLIRRLAHGDMPIVFIPGWTMSTKVFGRQLAHFRESNRWRAISYDPKPAGACWRTRAPRTSNGLPKSRLKHPPR